MNLDSFVIEQADRNFLRFVTWVDSISFFPTWLCCTGYKFAFQALICRMHCISQLSTRAVELVSPRCSLERVRASLDWRGGGRKKGWINLVWMQNFISMHISSHNLETIFSLPWQTAKLREEPQRRTKPLTHIQINIPKEHFMSILTWSYSKWALDRNKPRVLSEHTMPTVLFSLPTSHSYSLGRNHPPLECQSPKLPAHPW